MFVVGAIDDLREVSPPAKIAGQVLSGSILSLLGVTMLYFRVPFASYEYVVLSPDLAPLVTVLTVVVMANAINLIDGLDGLACGIVMIAGAALFLYADRLFKAGLLEGSNMGPLVAAITVGICVGFLPHNFNPARIFMGDAGAMFLGLLLATTTITVGGRTADPFSGQTYFYFAPLAIPLVILGVPIFDTAFSFVRRLVKRQSFAAGRPRAPAPPAHAHGARSPTRGRDPLAVDRPALGGRAAADVHRPRQLAGAARSSWPSRLLLYIYFHPGVRSARAAEAPGEDRGRPATPPRWSNLEPRRSGGSGAGAQVPEGGTAERNRPLARVLPAENFGLHTAPGLTFRAGCRIACEYIHKRLALVTRPGTEGIPGWTQPTSRHVRRRGTATA